MKSLIRKSPYFFGATLILGGVCATILSIILLGYIGGFFLVAGLVSVDEAVNGFFKAPYWKALVIGIGFAFITAMATAICCVLWGLVRDALKALHRLNQSAGKWLIKSIS